MKKSNKLMQLSPKKKALACALAAVLAFSGVPIAYGTGSSASEETATLESIGMSTVDVALDIQHAYIEINDQTVAWPATKVSVPAWTDVEFTAQADTGYEITQVNFDDNGVVEELEANDEGVYTIPSGMVEGDVKIAIETEQVEVAENTEATTIENKESVAASDNEESVAEPVVSADSATKDSAAASDNKESVAEPNNKESVAEPVVSADSATKTEYKFEDTNVKVTATLSDASAVPDDATFVVKQVTKESTGYNYDAYMQALNDDASAEIEAGDETEYTDENTLLYDVAFMVEKDGETVEYQPAEGSVDVKFEFKANQLSGELGATESEDVLVKHLPLVDSVRDEASSTEEATNITASDIKVEEVAATASVSGTETAELTVQNFSVFAFKDNRGQLNTWSGKTEFSYSDIINSLGETTGFAVYANRLKNSIHIEGNVKVGVLDIIGSEGLNKENAVIQRNAIKSIIVTKEVEGATGGTFNFGVYKSNDVTKGHEVKTFEITVPAGQTRTQVTLDSSNASGVLAAVATQDVVIFELDSNGDIVAQGGSLDGKYTVSYTGNTVQSSANNDMYSNYIGAIKNTNGYTLDNKFFFGEGVRAVTYIESLDNLRFEGSANKALKFESTADGVTTTTSIGDYSNIETDINNLQLIKQQDGITAQVSNTLNNLKAYSSALATAKNGATAGRNSLSVINVVSSTGNLQQDLDSANFKSVVNGGGEGIRETINEGGYLLVNIDVTGRDTYFLNKLVIDGIDPDSGNEELARHIIYNFVTHTGDKDAQGNYTSYEPFTGTVTIDNLSGGTIFVPAGKVMHNGGIRGAIIADEYTHTSGSEIHKDTISRQTTAQVFIKNSTKGGGQEDVVVPATLSVEGTKMIEGRDFKAGDSFTFTIEGQDGAPSFSNPTVTVTPESGTSAELDFGFARFVNEGTFVYKVSETSVSEAGVTSDGNAVTVTVTVTKNEDNKLVANATYEKADEAQSGVVFTNKYKAKETTAQVAATKTFAAGEWPEGEEFTFVLTPQGAVNAQGTAIENPLASAVEKTVTKEAANALFDEITFTQAGTYNYTLTESHPADATLVNGVWMKDGVAFDGTTHNVTVKVVDKLDGTLEATVVYDGDANGNGSTTAPVFINSYTNTQKFEASAQFAFNKFFYGTSASKFTFTLTAADENGKARGGEGAFDGIDNGEAFTMSAIAESFDANFSALVNFEKIGYEKAGVYYYTVSEDAIDNDNISMDDTVYLVRVTVSDDQKAVAEYKILGEDGDFAAFDEAELPAFYNNELVTMSFATFAMAGETEEDANHVISVDPIAKKTMVDEEGVEVTLRDGQFSFDLIDASTGEVVKTVNNSASGEIELGLLSFDEPGTYSYIIREQEGQSNCVTYDKTEFAMTITITEDEAGELSSEIAYTNKETGEAVSDPTFENKFEGMDVRVQKVSRFGGEGLTDCTYALWMVTPAGDVELAQATSDESGYITFKDVDMISGVKYYFKEVKAPSGHTVDPYRTAYFTLNDEGTALKVVEATAADGWHAAGYKESASESEGK